MEEGADAEVGARAVEADQLDPQEQSGQGEKHTYLSTECVSCGLSSQAEPAGTNANKSFFIFDHYIKRSFVTPCVGAIGIANVIGWI